MSSYTDEKELLVAEYGEICFLGGTIGPKNVLSCHHIRPINKNGKNNLNNIALMCRLEHDMLHLLAEIKPQTAKEISDYLHDFKIYRDMLARVQMRRKLLRDIKDSGFIVVEHPKAFVLQSIEEPNDLGKKYYMKKIRRKANG